MKTRHLLASAATRAILALLAAFALSALCRPASAQDYRTIANARFNTVSNGPLQALVVDVPNVGDAAGVTRAVVAKVNAARGARRGALLRELDILRRTFRWKGDLTPGIADIVMVRQQGRLMVAPVKGRTRANNDLTFTFPVSATGGDGGWSQQQAAQLQQIAGIMYPVLKTIYGDPSWSGTVTVTDADNLQGLQEDPDVVAGGVYNVSQNQILLAQYKSTQSTVLNLTQMMAIAFHGPASISFDAWERGMARAATIQAAFTAHSALDTAFGAGSVDYTDPLWHALDRYDLLNQPPLANDRFYPVSKQTGVANTSTFPLMLIPRLMMSGSAWLKCLAESPSFLSAFNTAYYQAVATDPTIKNSVPALKSIAAGVLPQVEGLPFTTQGTTPGWYERQYVLDTSVTPGVKLYAFVVALRPATAADNDFAVGVVLYYYRTSFDGTNSDETNLNGTSFPIYWDYTFANRLFLGAQYERVDIRDGIGSVAPTFPDTLGGDPNLHGQMRIAMDFPVNNENVRLQMSPRSMGGQDNPNNFWGVVVGADTGTLNITTDTGVNVTNIPVAQGAFGTKLDPAAGAFTRPAKATIEFVDTQNHHTVFRVNTGFNEYIAVLYASDPVQSVTHTFPAGPSMISFPLQPLKPRAEDALLDPNTGNPLFGHTNLLLAEWRQDINDPAGNNFLIYPSLGPLQPGKGYWSQFDTNTNIRIDGKVLTAEQGVSIALLPGWNQIASPFLSAINVSSLQFQHQADNVPVDLPTAITNGWIGSSSGPTPMTIIGFDPQLGYQPVTGTLDPWKSYWVRVTAPEGVTITYPNPATGRAVPVPAKGKAAAKPAAGWSLGITVRGSDGVGSTAWLGMSDQADAGDNLKMNALRPPEFSRNVPVVAFAHPERTAAPGNYMTEIHKTGSRDPWEITVSTPDPTKTYTLSWSGLSAVPRATRLILIDEATGTRQYLQSSSGYSFVAGSAATRRFQILPENRGPGQLRILNVIARPTRAAGANTVEIGYELTAGANVTTEIRGLNGRLVRHLAQGRAATTGANSLIWDTRDDRSMAVPSGAYLITVTARTPEGEQARMIVPVTIVR